jgi:peptide/nickel transport system permease protein
MGGRTGFILRRLGKAVVVLFGIIVLNFILIRLVPGDPAMVIAGESGAADEKYLADLRREFGLDRPLPEQLFIYVRNVATFDLGFSHRQKERVSTLILDRLPQTILLTGTAVLFAIALGVTLGAVSARRVGTWTDSLISLLGLVVYATPSFWIGLMAVLLFSVYLDWLPAFGYQTIGTHPTGLAFALDIARHLVLPATTLGLFFVAIYARLTRASMLEVAQMDFVRTARAKGVPEGRVTRSHILRNALLPIVTFAGVQAGYLVGGSILIETVFAWPGVGRLAFEAVAARDYNLLLGVFIVTSVMVIAFNLITDLTYTIVDPRIEIGQ